MDLNFEINSSWVPHKRANITISDLYKVNKDYRHYSALKDCGSALRFARGLDVDTGELSEDCRLDRANFCRVRMCPMCNWRRSLVAFSNLSQMLQWVDIKKGKFKFVFLTLTVINVTAAELPFTLDRMFNAWGKLTKLLKCCDENCRSCRVRNKSKCDHHRANTWADCWSVVAGYFRSLEVTYNESANTYHPHIHALLLVPENYAESGRYVTHDEWLNAWRWAYDDPNILMVNVKMVKDLENGGLSEVAKYVSKLDFLLNKGLDASKRASVLKVLDNALNGRRLSCVGGVLYEACRELKLMDPDEADLLHIGIDKPHWAVEMLYSFGWRFGNYELINLEVRYNEKSEDI